MQLPQVRQRSATSSQRGCSRLSRKQVADVASVELPSHPGGRVLGLGRRRGPVLVGRVGASKLTEDLLAAVAARLDQKPVPALEELGQYKVVALACRRACVHRDAEARPGRLVAIDCDEERVLAPGGVVAVDVPAAEENPVLDPDRRQLAGADADECERARLDRLLLYLEVDAVLLRLPEPYPRREEEALPGGRADRVAEARVVVPALESVEASVLDVRPPRRQRSSGVEFFVDDRAVAHSRAHDGVTAG